ncbi:hydroxymethylbilane synthase [Magnetococcus marinus MC-1]|uniref:Porphobilinogen deaminase n=1 Tax=Magnetococcus marinus (strain ATCC BAA-1437 / JCM 17883 / MC-1) TaxID=156889 RepID=A0L5L5_MAGMM|nr:hydroxymethylbilane synthase [Magnetococcus marinus]ABK43258.1 hydroxymethylbilane synthase [Magnetococcus marinus MC-1]
MSDPQLVRIGTRGSALAVWQAEWVKSQLQAHHPGIIVELELIKTKGDKILDVPLAKVGGKGLFVKELEEAMLDGRVDLAVHSMKDVPAEFPDGLMLGPILKREDPRDALLSIHYQSLAELPQGALIGSSSLRRQSQIKAKRPDLRLDWLRGNVGTRIQKLVEGQFDAIILAAAGVKRLGLTEHVVQYLEPEEMLPAVGQGAVGIEHRVDDARIATLLAPLYHKETHSCVTAERAFLAKLEGGCQVPIAGYATLHEDTLTLRGLVAEVEGGRVVQAQCQGPRADAYRMGQQLATQLLEAGGGAILQAVYNQDTLS